MSATSWPQARIAALDAVSRSNSGRGMNVPMMIDQAALLAEWIMETPGAGPSAVGACNPPPAGPVGEAAATAEDPTSAPHRGTLDGSPCALCGDS